MPATWALSLLSMWVTEVLVFMAFNIRHLAFKFIKMSSLLSFCVRYDCSLFHVACVRCLNHWWWSESVMERNLRDLGSCSGFALLSVTKAKCFSFFIGKIIIASLFDEVGWVLSFVFWATPWGELRVCSWLRTCSGFWQGPYYVGMELGSPI